MKQLLITITAVVLVGCGPSMSIHEAALEGNIEAVKQHLAAGTDVNDKNRSGETPLYNAAEWGHKAVAELLIAEGADVNAKSNEGWTPLHNAQGNEIVELLIAEGANVNAKNVKGKTPLDHNQFPRYQKQADLLRKHGGKMGEELKAEGK